MGIAAVIFDLDGVILDSEPVWHRVRHDFVTGHGGRWAEEDHRAVMGANSMQWSHYIHDTCGVTLSPEEIYAGVVARLQESYQTYLPLYPGAVEVVRGVSRVYPLAVASSSPRELIESVLELSQLRASFQAVVSSDDVARGKPEPDVYLEACRRLGCRPQHTVAVEDSGNGIRAALAAGMLVIAIPNHVFPPTDDVIARADTVLGSTAELGLAVLVQIEDKLAREVCDGRCG